MTPFIKFSLILGVCIVTLLIFVNIVEKSIHRERRKNLDDDSFFDLLKSKYNKSRLLNLENFEYEIRPSACNSTFLTWIVTSYAADPAPRSALRRAYSTDELQQLGIKRVFLLGKLVHSTEVKYGITQASLHNEADRFDDIVQGNFFEAYRNLTYKHLMGLKWASENCANAPYIMKQDDDIVINLYDIVEKLKLLNSSRNDIFAGYVLKGMKPIREPANKWFVTNNEYDKNSYPDFLSGWLYIVDREIAIKLIERSETREKYFWIDDVLLTGILREELNIPLIDMHKLYTTDYRYLICCMRGAKKHLKCDFAIGPNGGKIKLQIDFQRFAAYCRNHYCSTREIPVGKSCVVEYKNDKIEIGSAKIEPVKFL